MRVIRLSADYTGNVVAAEPGMLAVRPLVGSLIVGLCVALALPSLARRALGIPASPDAARRTFAVRLLRV